MTMNYKDQKKDHEHDSMLMGAIFMSNRKTKEECLKRNLFGLPASKTSFITKIKAGMLLFLFENEERKLYGVFEATCDGALNIVPNAYISSGSSFPAQVLFRRIWMCKPLTEDEFGVAIKENYYTPHKFHFGLSYDQVCKLVNLFSSKKIRVNLPPRGGIPNNIIRDFEISDGDSLPVTGHGSYQMSPHAGKPSSLSPMHHNYHDQLTSRGKIPSYTSQYFPTSGDGIPPVISNTPLSLEPKTLTSPSMFPQIPSLNRTHQTEAINYPSSIYWASLPSSGVSLPSVPYNGQTDLQNLKYVTHPDRYDPSDPKITFGPANCQVVHDAETEFDPNERQLWGASTLSDYIPLPRDHDSNIDQQSCGLHSPHGSYSEFEEIKGFRERQPYPPTFADEYYPTDTKSRLHSDTERNRTSVFSRLSKTQESRKTHVYVEHDSGDSRELLNNLSQRRGEILKSETASSNKKRTKGPLTTDSSRLTFVDDKLLSSTDTVDDESIVAADDERIEAPFMNFKRRSEIRRTAREDVTDLHVCDGNKELLGNYKRRKLVRPSLNGESCNLDGVSIENLELRKMNKEGENVTVTCENDGEGIIEQGEWNKEDDKDSVMSEHTTQLGEKSIKDEENNFMVEYISEQGEESKEDKKDDASNKLMSEIKSDGHQTGCVRLAEKIVEECDPTDDKNENNQVSEDSPSSKRGHTIESQTLRWFLGKRG